MRVIFIHHAGGDRYAFREYKPLVESAGWEFISYEFPGHGDRFNEALLHTADELAEDAFDRLRSHFISGKTVLFGNSMGSLIAYLLLLRTRERGLNMPQHFVASARKAPDAYRTAPPASELPDREFREMIRAYGGSSGLLEQPELMEVYEPILKADYNVLAGYDHRPAQPLALPVTILYGTEDRYSEADIRTWQPHFAADPEIHPVRGGHFFVYEQPETVFSILRPILESI